MSVPVSRFRLGLRSAGSSILRLSSFLLLGCLFGCMPVLAQSADQPAPQQRSEVERLRDEVQQLRDEVERLRSAVLKSAAENAPNNGQPSTAAANPQSSATDQPGGQSQTRRDAAGAPQSTSSTADNPGIAIATKAQGGDLSGAGNLLRTDRITIGGYGDLQFRGTGINERAEGGDTPTFTKPRFVLGVAAVLSEKQNIFFNSELEYEFGGEEVDLEQAFVEWKARPEFAFRGGVFVPALGRFNVYHDSNLNLTAIRPLLNQFIIPTAYSDAGLGVRGRFKLPRGMNLSYELDLLNGMRS